MSQSSRRVEGDTPVPADLRADRDETEEHDRAFFALNAVGASETSLPDGRFLRVNDALCVMTGYTREELLTMRFIELVHPEERASGLERLMALGSGALRSFTLDKRYVRKDGAILWVHLELHAELGRDGRPAYATSVIQDITDRKRVEQALREANERYRLATRCGRVGVWEWDAETDTIDAEDRTLSEILGFEDRRRETGAAWLETVHPADRDRVLAVWRSLTEGARDTVEYEYRIVNADGAVWWQNTRCTVSRREAGRVRRIVGVTVDTTERRQAEEALRVSEERYRSFFELNAVGAAEVDLAAGRYVRVNDAYCQMLGYSREELLDLTFADITYPDDRDEDARLFATLIRGQIPTYRLEKRYVRKDGTVLWAQLAVTLIRNSAGEAVSEVGLVLDITDRKQAEQDLQWLAGRLLQSQDDERRRIAQELHDQTAQTMFAINLNLVQLLDATPALDNQARSIVAESLGLGQHLLQEMRTLSYLLHPPLLDQVGLASALEWYVDGFSKRSGITVELALAPDIGRLPSDAETALFRIVQESLTNVHRHARSERASIRLARESERIVLEIQDSGRGVTGETQAAGEDVRSLGVGISGMRQRMRQLGGELAIRSDAAGTRVTAVVPVGEDTGRD